MAAGRHGTSCPKVGEARADQSSSDLETPMFAMGSEQTPGNDREGRKPAWSLTWPIADRPLVSVMGGKRTLAEPRLSGGSCELCGFCFALV